MPKRMESMQMKGNNCEICAKEEGKSKHSIFQFSSVHNSSYLYQRKRRIEISLTKSTKPDRYSHFAKVVVRWQWRFLLFKNRVPLLHHILSWRAPNWFIVSIWCIKWPSSLAWRGNMNEKKQCMDHEVSNWFVIKTQLDSALSFLSVKSASWNDWNEMTENYPVGGEEGSRSRK